MGTFSQQMLCTPDGRKAVDQLAQNPNRPLNQFSKLAFRDWIENVEPSLVGNTVPPPTDSHMIPVTLSYAVYNIFQQYWEGQNDPLYAILSRRGHSVDWVHVFASQEEIDRLGEVAMEIIDDPESEKPAIATAESLLPKLKEAGWKDHD